ncbi:hypothetical protein FQZ97_890660 [compost metagenome]
MGQTLAVGMGPCPHRAAHTAADRCQLHALLRRCHRLRVHPCELHATVPVGELPNAARENRSGCGRLLDSGSHDRVSHGVLRQSCAEQRTVNRRSAGDHSAVDQHADACLCLETHPGRARDPQLVSGLDRDTGHPQHRIPLHGILRVPDLYLHLDSVHLRVCLCRAGAHP